MPGELRRNGRPHIGRALGHVIDRNRGEAMLESAPDAMVMADEQGEITVVNARAGSLFGYERNELLGQPLGRVPVRQL